MVRIFILPDILISRDKKIHLFEFFLILADARFSIAAVSAPVVRVNLWFCTALSTKPLPVGVRMIKVVIPAGLPIDPAEISDRTAVRSVQ